MHLSKLYKRLILVLMVVGPIWWTMFTDDGRRRTDLAVLWLTGRPSVSLNLAALDDGWNEEQLRRALPDPEWSCLDRRSRWGERLCFTEVAGFNGTPARYLTLFFRDGRLSALKLGYRRAYQERLEGQLSRLFSETEPEETGQVRQWRTDQGVAILPRHPQNQEEAVLFWLSRDELVRDRGETRRSMRKL